MAAGQPLGFSQHGGGVAAFAVIFSCDRIIPQYILLESRQPLLRPLFLIPGTNNHQNHSKKALKYRRDRELRPSTSKA